MQVLADVLLPILALIGIGYVCRRRSLLGAGALPAINAFVVVLALPALLFRIMANAALPAVAAPGPLLAYGGSMLLVFLATLGLSLRRGLDCADATVDGLSASYANVGFLGLPMVQLLYGDAMMTPAGVCVLLTACALFALGLTLVELQLNRRATLRASLWATARALGRNPLMLAPAAGVVVSAFGLPLPAAVATIVNLLAAAASPCALVALGLFIAEQQGQPATAADGCWQLVAMKALVHPALAWGIASPLLHLPATEVALCVLMALMPTGTGPFMLAERYGRRAPVAARTILLSTLVCALLICVHLLVAGPR